MKRIVAIEGCDGSGKRTQAELLHKNIFMSELVSFPRYDTDTGKLCRNYLNGDYGDITSLSPYAISAIYALDRALSFNRDEWGKNFYTEYGTVIMDRYIYSNIIHQASKYICTANDKTTTISLGPGSIEHIEVEEFIHNLLMMESRFGVPSADIIVYLDIPTEVSNKLINTRYSGDESKKDIHESNLEYLKHCRDIGVHIMKKLGAVIIDCTDGRGNMRIPEDINDEIMGKIRCFLK